MICNVNAMQRLADIALSSGYEKLERLGCGYAGVVPRGLDKEQAACNVREPSWHMPWNI